MLDSPPPSTIASGSSRLMTCARPRARRSVWRARRLLGARLAGGGTGRQAAGVVRIRAVAVARQGGAGDEGLQAAPLAAPALRAGEFVRRAARAAGLWPHSPATRVRRRDAPARPPTMPPPTPVPRMTPNTTPVAGAGAVGRLATGRSSWRRSRPAPRGPAARLMSWSNGWPFSVVELAFFTRPVAGLITPGMPMPTVAVTPSCASVVAHQAGDRLRPSRHSRAAWAMRWRSASLPSGREHDDLDLGAAEVDADAVLGHDQVNLQRCRRHLQAAMRPAASRLSGAAATFAGAGGFVRARAFARAGLGRATQAAFRRHDACSGA